MTKYFAYLGGICTAVSMFVGGMWWYGNQEGYAPRWAWISELRAAEQSIEEQMSDVLTLAAESSVRAATQAKRSDERTLYDLNLKIEDLRQKGQPVPDELKAQRQRVIEDIDDHKRQIERSLKRLEKR